MASYASATPMIRARKGISIAIDAIWIAHSIDALVVRPDDVCDLRVIVDVAQDPLADFGVLLHLPAFLEGQRARLFEQARRQADLADVVHQTAEVDELLLLLRQSDALRDVSRVDRDRRRMTCRVLIAGIERRNESSGEREAGPSELVICCRQPVCRLLLLPVEVEKSLCGKRRNEKHEHEFERVGVVGVDEKRQERGRRAAP